MAFGLLAQSNFAIGLQRHDKVLLQVVLDKQHVVGGTIPYVTQDNLEWAGIALRCRQQLALILVLADGRASFAFAGLFIGGGFRFCYNTEPNWQRVALRMIQTRHKIDAVEASFLAVIPVPADNVVLVGVRLLCNTIVNNQHSLFVLNLAHIGLDNAPHIGCIKPFFRQQPLYLVMPDTASQQPSPARPTGLTKGANQIFTLDVQQFVRVHLISLAHPCLR